jgi:hypothetical protein
MPSGFTVGSCQVQGGVARLCALSLPSALAGFIAYLFKLDPRHVDTSPDAVELGLIRAELKAFPSHETKVRTGAYPPVDDPLANVMYPRSEGGYMVLQQRSVPDAAIEVRRGMPVCGARGRLLEKVDNVVVDPVHRRISYIPTASARRVV